MSLRPRFAGDGRLRLPATVSLPRTQIPEGELGLVVGELGDATYDPFERDAEGLLLAEAFARVDLTQKRSARTWFLGHGSLSLETTFPEDHSAGRPLIEDDFVDNLLEVAGEQRAVRWHLLALARLSAHRDRVGAPRADRTPHEGWDPSWAQVALISPKEIIWFGGRSDFERRFLVDMGLHATWDDAPEDTRMRSTVPGQLRAIKDEWWPQAHAAWQRIRDGDVPILPVSSADWLADWYWWGSDEAPWPGRPPSGPVHTDWHGLVDLQRRLIQPYVRRAAVHEVLVEATDPDDSGIVPTAGPIRVRERRVWKSLLAPVYLQLLEGLRRVSEGHSGAAWCRECDEPFLTLDARRSSFCNDKERYRFSQRERRKRVSTANEQPWMPPRRALREATRRAIDASSKNPAP